MEAESALRRFHALRNLGAEIFGVLGFGHGFESIERPRAEELYAIGLIDLAHAVELRFVEQSAGHHSDEVGSRYLERAGFETVLGFGDIIRGAGGRGGL